MKHFSFAIIAFLAASCVQAPKHEPQTPKPPLGPVSDTEIVELALASGYQCYLTKFGSEVRSDGSVECPPKSEVDRIQREVSRANKIKPKQWETFALFYTNKAMDCGGIGAMGCTRPLSDNYMQAVVSLRLPWRRATLRHELTHVAYFWNGEPEEKHLCLDSPGMCAGSGKLKLNFLGD